MARLPKAGWPFRKRTILTVFHRFDDYLHGDIKTRARNHISPMLALSYIGDFSFQQAVFLSLVIAFYGINKTHIYS